MARTIAVGFAAATAMLLAATTTNVAAASGRLPAAGAAGLTIETAEISGGRLLIVGLAAKAGQVVTLDDVGNVSTADANGRFRFAPVWRPADCVATLVAGGRKQKVPIDHCAAVGETGKTGAAGATGLTGPQGATGATGGTGPQGATGATGPRGAAGAAGPAGSAGINGTDNLLETVSLTGTVSTSVTTGSWQFISTLPVATAAVDAGARLIAGGVAAMGASGTAFSYEFGFCHQDATNGTITPFLVRANTTAVGATGGGVADIVSATSTTTITTADTYGVGLCVYLDDGEALSVGGRFNGWFQVIE